MQPQSCNKTSLKREIRRMGRGDDFASCQKMRSEDRSQSRGDSAPCGSLKTVSLEVPLVGLICSGPASDGPLRVQGNRGSKQSNMSGTARAATPTDF